jgi:hypothetical protein
VEIFGRSEQKEWINDNYWDYKNNVKNKGQLEIFK